MLEVWVTGLADAADTTAWRLVREGTIIAIGEARRF